jgi:hypothetical protein
MALPSFTGLSPAATRAYILHISNASLTSAPVYAGDGRATPLTFTTAGISIAGDVAATTLTLTGAAIVPGTLTLGGLTVRPAVWKTLTGNVLATDTTAVALTELSFTPVSGATYEVEMMLIVTSAATAGAAQITNTGGAGTLYLLDPQTALGITATGGSYLPTTSPVAGTWALLLKGVFIASSTAALTFAIKSDDTNDVTALIGSYLRVTRIA